MSQMYMFYISALGRKFFLFFFSQTLDAQGTFSAAHCGKLKITYFKLTIPQMGLESNGRAYLLDHLNSKED